MTAFLITFEFLVITNIKQFVIILPINARVKAIVASAALIEFVANSSAIEKLVDNELAIPPKNAAAMNMSPPNFCAIPNMKNKTMTAMPNLAAVITLNGDEILSLIFSFLPDRITKAATAKAMKISAPGNARYISNAGAMAITTMKFLSSIAEFNR